MLQKLSHLPDYAVDALKKACKTEGKTDENDKKLSLESIEYQDALPFGGTWIVWSLLQQLGIIKALRLLPKQHQAPIIASIIDRVINPKPHSKRALSKQFKSSLTHRLTSSDEQLCLKDWYAALDSLCLHQMAIQKKLFHKDTQKIYLYDITSSYFEGKACPLATWGYNRDGKKGKQIIVIGLLTTSDGCPLAVRVFKGNTSDQTTVIAQMQELRDEFGVTDVIFVGDRGMLTSKRITEIEDGDFNWLQYITALPRKAMMHLVDQADHPLQIGLFDEKNLIEVDHEGTRYILCHNPLRKDEDSITRLRLLDKTAAKLESIANNVAAGRLKKKDKIARRLYRWINHWNMERFFEVDYSEGHFQFSRKTDEIERYSVLDGCYVIVSTVAASSLDSSHVQSVYKDLQKVEKAFRSMKVSDLFLRPVRHWNETRVRGHVFMCMLAYRVVWESRHRLQPLLERDPDTRQCEGGSLREIWDCMNRLTIGRMKIEGKDYEQIGAVTKAQAQIICLLKTPLTKAAHALCRQKNEIS